MKLVTFLGPPRTVHTKSLSSMLRGCALAKYSTFIAGGYDLQMPVSLPAPKNGHADKDTGTASPKNEPFILTY